jgi:hypothetical protein
MADVRINGFAQPCAQWAAASSLCFVKRCVPQLT